MLTVPLTRGSTTKLRPVMSATAVTTASISALTKFSVTVVRDVGPAGRRAEAGRQGRLRRAARAARPDASATSMAARANDSRGERGETRRTRDGGPDRRAGGPSGSELGRWRCVKKLRPIIAWGMHDQRVAYDSRAGSPVGTAVRGSRRPRRRRIRIARSPHPTATTTPSRSPDDVRRSPAWPAARSRRLVLGTALAGRLGLRASLRGAGRSAGVRARRLAASRPSRPRRRSAPPASRRPRGGGQGEDADRRRRDLDRRRAASRSARTAAARRPRGWRSTTPSSTRSRSSSRRRPGSPRLVFMVTGARVPHAAADHRR